MNALSYFIAVYVKTGKALSARGPVIAITYDGQRKGYHSLCCA